MGYGIKMQAHDHINTLDSPSVKALLARLHRESEAQLPALWHHIQQIKREGLTGLAWVDRLKDFSLAITPTQGQFLYRVALGIRAQTIVEFGTSVGISTIYLAAALKDLGMGKVIGSEMLASKVALANQHLAEAGLSDWADILPGDALATLQSISTPVDLLFLDGEPDYHLKVVQMLTPKFRHQTLIVADNVGHQSDPYVAFINQPSSGFLSERVPVGGGADFYVSVWVGARA